MQAKLAADGIHPWTAYDTAANADRQVRTPRERQHPQWPPRLPFRPWRAPTASTPASTTLRLRPRPRPPKTAAACPRPLTPPRRRHPHPSSSRRQRRRQRTMRRRSTACTRCCTRTWASRRCSTASRPALRAPGWVPPRRRESACLLMASPGLCRLPQASRRP